VVGGRERRAADRLDMNLAPGTLEYLGARMSCNLVNLSLTGCCVKTGEDFKAGALAQVKVTVPIDGMVLSIGGVTEWVKGTRTLGIHFIHPTGGSKNQLAGLLTCLLDRSSSEVVRAAIAADAESLTISLDGALPCAAGSATALTVANDAPQAAVIPTRIPLLTDMHTVQDPGEKESPAVLHLVAGEMQLGGHILGLSSSGCIVWVHHPYPGNIRVRVEVDFQVRGLHFRMPGVTEAFHDKHTVEIRFINVSPRKKEGLDQVVQEMFEREMIEVEGKQSSAAEDAPDAPEAGA
jgi:hypothetical protein